MTKTSRIAPTMRALKRMDREKTERTRYIAAQAMQARMAMEYYNELASRRLELITIY